MANHGLYVVDYLNGKRIVRNYLSEELLVEILCRLPTCKSALQCKRVCKQWARLISSPHFVTRFVETKLARLSDTTRSKDIGIEKESFFLVAQPQPHKRWTGLTMRFDDPVSNTHDFSISALPCLPGHENATPIKIIGGITHLDDGVIQIVGASSDLVFYRRYGDKRYDYYIQNVQTKQWVSVPATPFHCRQYDYDAFLCDPLYSYKSGKNSVSVNAVIRRYCIVVIHYTREASTKHTAHIFSSVTYQWTDVVLSLPRAWTLGVSCGSFVFNGIIHCGCVNGMIIFDPFRAPNGIVDCRLIDWPVDFYSIFACPGVRQGHLQMFSYDQELEFLFVWVLKDYERGEWSLLHKIARQEWLVHHSSISINSDKRGWPGIIIGQHPTNPDIVYLLSNFSIVICDFSKRTLDLASRVSAIPLLFQISAKPLNLANATAPFIRFIIVLVLSP